MKRVAIALGGLLGALCLFLAITWIALEGQEVVVLRTFDSTGLAHEARVWIADDAGFAWLEAANTERRFFRHILAKPAVEVVRRGIVHRYHAVPVTTRDAHQHIRQLLAKKYGLADRWIGLLEDTSASVAIRLERRDAHRPSDEDE